MPKKKKPVSKRRSRDSKSQEATRSSRHEAVRRELVISEEQKQDMEKEIPSMKVITPSSIAQKYGVRVSIAKAVLAELESKGLIRQITSEGKFRLYSKATG